jgi:hypothetical protein
MSLLVVAADTRDVLLLWLLLLLLLQADLGVL